MAAGPPLIGITSYGRNEEDKFSLPANYVASVRRAGGIPVLLPVSCACAVVFFFLIRFLLRTSRELARCQAMSRSP